MVIGRCFVGTEKVGRAERAEKVGGMNLWKRRGGQGRCGEMWREIFARHYLSGSAWW